MYPSTQYFRIIIKQNFLISNRSTKPTSIPVTPVYSQIKIKTAIFLPMNIHNMCSESSSNVSDNENKSKFLPLQLKKSSPIAINSVKSSEYENKETLAMSQLRYEYQQQTMAMYNR